MSNTTAAPVHTFFISALGLEGGETLHYNGTTFSILFTDVPVGGSLMRAFYAHPEGGVDWLVLDKCEMVTVS